MIILNGKAKLCLDESMDRGHPDELVAERAASEVSFLASQSAGLQRGIQPLLHVVAVESMLGRFLECTEIHHAIPLVVPVRAVLRYVAFKYQA
jgi:hypothetical protein